MGPNLPPTLHPSLLLHPGPRGGEGEERARAARLSPGLQPWHQAPTLALINPFLVTLPGGEADLGGLPPHPSLPRGLLGAVLTEVGGESLPPSMVGESSEIPRFKYLNESRGQGRRRGFSSNKLLAFLFFLVSVGGMGGGAGCGLQGPPSPYW